MEKPLGPLTEERPINFWAEKRRLFWGEAAEKSLQGPILKLDRFDFYLVSAIRSAFSPIRSRRGLGISDSTLQLSV